MPPRPLSRFLVREGRLSMWHVRQPLSCVPTKHWIQRNEEICDVPMRVLRRLLPADAQGAVNVTSLRAPRQHSFRCSPRVSLTIVFSERKLPPSSASRYSCLGCCDKADPAVRDRAGFVGYYDKAGGHHHRRRASSSIFLAGPVCNKYCSTNG